MWPTKRDTFMSNIPAAHKHLILEAARQTGYDIFVEDEATTKDGYPMPAFVAVHTNEGSRDYAIFWNRFYQLKVEAGVTNF